MNKRDAEIVNSYERSSIHNLYEAYGRFSNKKAEAGSIVRNSVKRVMVKD